MSTPVPLFLVDAFSDHPFAGNPAAVCLTDRREANWLQSVAAEMNQAETAFLSARTDGDWDLRWFTPTVEVDLCGHATLASAHVLWSTSRVDRAQPIRFHTKSGVLTCRLRGEQIEMDFPAEPASAGRIARRGRIAAWRHTGLRRSQSDGHARRPWNGRRGSPFEA